MQESQLTTSHAIFGHWRLMCTVNEQVVMFGSCSAARRRGSASVRDSARSWQQVGDQRRDMYVYSVIRQDPRPATTPGFTGFNAF